MRSYKVTPIPNHPHGLCIDSHGDLYVAEVGELCDHANLADASARTVYRQWDAADCDDGFVRLAPVGSFQPNPFGLYDIHGNVAEWVLECGMPDYRDAPEDGAEVIPGPACRTHAFRGGSWDSQPDGLASRRRGSGRGPADDRGIRLVREL